MKDNAQFLIWWTNQRDAEDAAATVKSFVPKYIVEEFQSRFGRPGRGRLWVPTHEDFAGISASGIVWDETVPRIEYMNDAAGIVFRIEDYEHLKNHPGLITDVHMKEYTT